MGRKMKSLRERLEQKFVKGRPDECWEWTAAINSSGYGMIGLGRRTDGTVHAHRAAFKIYVGEIPDGLDVCHTCDNRICVNPNHLYTGTRKDNMQDCVKRGRTNKPSGENHPRARLTVQDVIEIRASTKSMNELAAQYGVGLTTIQNVLHRKSWKCVATNQTDIHVIKNKRDKLTVSDVESIRKSNATSRELSKKYGVCTSNINYIRNYKIWKNI